MPTASRSTTPLRAAPRRRPSKQRRIARKTLPCPAARRGIWRSGSLCSSLERGIALWFCGKGRRLKARQCACRNPHPTRFAGRPPPFRGRLRGSAIRRSVARHLERIVEGRHILAWVVLRIGELRDAEIVRPRFVALVDARIEIDEMPAGLASRLHDQLDVALAVEGAGIADVIVVVDHVNDVGGLAPTYALEMQAEGGAGRPVSNIDR